MPHAHTPMPRQQGFTLVELMVGMLLAMLTTVIVAQVMVKAEGNRRATTSGSDAQVNGALALFSLQREVQGAGYGLAINPTALGCTVNYKYGSATANSFTLAPVVITQGASGAPDTIKVLSSAKNGGSVPVILTAVHAQAASVFTVKASFGTSEGDLMVAVPAAYGTGNDCTLFQTVSDASFTLGDTIVPHVANTTWNTATAIYPSTGYPSGSTLVNLGAMVNRSYGIDANSNLVYNELTSGGPSAQPLVLFSQIVNLQALYGVDSTGTTGTVDTYTNVTPTTYTDWKKVLSVRVALVARSGNFEKDVVTAAQPQWDLGSNATITDTPASAACTAPLPTGHTCVTLKLNGDANWQHYRYRVYDTIIPLRNVLWNL